MMMTIHSASIASENQTELRVEFHEETPEPVAHSAFESRVRVAERSKSYNVNPGCPPVNVGENVIELRRGNEVLRRWVRPGYVEVSNG